MTTTALPPAPAPGAKPGKPVKIHKFSKSREGTPLSRTVKYGLLIIFVIIVFVPMYVLIVTSFKSNANINPQSAWAVPSTWSLEGWSKAWNALAAPMGRSLLIAVVASAVSSILGSMNGFVFSKWVFPGANIIFTLFLFGMFIPYQSIMIPLQGVMLDLNNNVGLPKGPATLILAHIVYGIPICTLIFRNYYTTAVPNEILEAAKVDGSGMLRTYWSIVLPVSIPAFVVTLIWQFTSAWNDFLFALFLSTRQTGPATYALNELAGGQNPDFSSSMAGALITSLPTLLVYIILGKYFVSGLMSGSVK